MDRVLSAQGIAQAVLRDVRSSGAVTLSQAVTKSFPSWRPEVGHPEFDHLEFDQSDDCDLALVFLDLNEFTARTFWDPPEQVVLLARAILNQYAYIIDSFGGYVLGFRGDGVFACFGGKDADPIPQATLALAATAFALDATQGAINNHLEMDGIRTVVARAGADFGRTDFVRLGTDKANQINHIGFAPNFAAKCEKKASGWSVVVGEGMAVHVNDGLLTRHEDSPKSYQLDGQRKTYNFYDVAWRRLLADLPGVVAELDGAASSSLRLVP